MSKAVDLMEELLVAFFSYIFFSFEKPKQNPFSELRFPRWAVSAGIIKASEGQKDSKEVQDTVYRQYSLHITQRVVKTMSRFGVKF